MIVAAVVAVAVILRPDWVDAALNADAPALPPIAAELETTRQADISGHARIVDGDGLEIGGQRIRLHGIDAFEMRQMCGANACGQASANALRHLVGGRPVDCVEMDRDRYGRSVAVCRAGGQDLGAAMVRQGHAVAYTRYSHRYVPEELAARRDNAGAWAHGFTPPEAWRRAS
ncbi:thermonuclease family protein [Brevundimonas sp.]|uniref:thermonuclease family protein n=1 Tax=Brevundimonas sp. TaxID=1871086 RepID=UPI00391AD757